MSNPYHVVYLLHSLGRGGTENGVVNLLNRMDPDRFRFTIALIKREKALLQRVDRDGVEIVTVGRRWGNDPLFPLKLMTLFRRLKPDLVHTRGFSCIEGVPAARMAGVKAIVHSEHGREIDEARRMKTRRAGLRSVLYPFASTVATVSEELADWLVQQVKVKRSKLVVLPNGVDVDRFKNLPSRDEARRKLGLPKDGLVIGSVGRHDPVKDYGSLLRAFVRVHDARDDVRLLLVGDGPQNEALRSAARDLLIDQRVDFHGWSDDLPLVLAAMDLFVLPSVTEGMSNALLEAMSAGLPCVATAVGGNAEVLVDGVTGHLVPPGHPVRLAEVLTELLANDERRLTLGTEGRRRASILFSLPAMVARYEDLYLALLEKGRTGASPTGRAAHPAGALPADVAARTPSSD